MTNTGNREGTDVPQLYIAPPGRTHRLAGWKRITLKPGESKMVTITADSRILASYGSNGWIRDAGRYRISVAQSAELGGLETTVSLRASRQR